MGTQQISYFHARGSGREIKLTGGQIKTMFIKFGDVSGFYAALQFDVFVHLDKNQNGHIDRQRTRWLWHCWASNSPDDEMMFADSLSR